MKCANCKWFETSQIIDEIGLIFVGCNKYSADLVFPISMYRNIKCECCCPDFIQGTYPMGYYGVEA